jgi:hypothetical protein
MFSVIKNNYNKKTKGPTLMELFTATGKLNKCFWQLESVHHGWHSTHWYNIQVLVTHVPTWVNLYSSLLQSSEPLGQQGPVVMVGHTNTSNISSCQKIFLSFPVAVNNSIKVGPFVFLL